MASFIKKIFGRFSDTDLYIKKNMQQAAAMKTARDVLKYAVKRVEIKNGLFLEFGVYSGDTINYISDLADQKIYGFDSFKGLPEFWRKGYDKGKFKTDTLPQVNENVELVVGWFHETLPGFTEQHPGPIAFMHVDCDLYSSAKTVFDNLKKRIALGTVIVFDEYFNYPGWEKGEFKAFQEFVQENNLGYQYIAYNSRHEQVAVKITSFFS